MKKKIISRLIRKRNRFFQAKKSIKSKFKIRKRNMKIEIIKKLELLMSDLNANQQKIAKNIIINRNFIFFENTVNTKVELFFRDNTTGEIYHFLTFVKKSCNCD
jgi:hypothetical protein